ncbi:MAG: hypothetical protein KAW87_03800 [Candidatus Cloacimonetes bacterium]|nr:hypothetical protein [Candidatus Cloacimonadota bacterium]
MMKGIKIIRNITIFMILFLLIISGCSKSTEPDKSHSDITGYVYDVNGIPVPDVAILPEYYLELSDSIIKKMNYNMIIDSVDTIPSFETKLYGNYPNPFFSCTTIAFRIGYHSQCYIYISEYKNKTDTVRIFIDEELYPGIHQVCWNGKNSDGKYVENGIYTVYLQTPEVIDSCYIFCMKEYTSSTNYQNYACKTHTNEEGKFNISQFDMPFECYVPHLDVDGNLLDTLYVSRYVKLWAFFDYHTPVFVDSVYVDPDKGANIEIQFED